jgi:exodeoxyribonuclease VII large subunit
MSVACDRVSGLLRSLKDPALFVGHLVQRVDDLAERLTRGFTGAMQLRRERLAGRVHRLHLRTPSLAIERFRERLISHSAGMERAMHRSLEMIREQSSVNAARLSTLSPLATLARGYSVVRSVPDERIINDSRQVAVGDNLLLTFRHGSATCVVESSSDEPCR